MRDALGIRTVKRDPIQNASALDAPIVKYGEDGATLLDTIAVPTEYPEENVEREELQAAVRAAVGRVEHAAARSAIEACYWQGKTLEQIAERNGVSSQHVSYLIYRGYRTLYNDPELQQWAIDYDYVNLHRHKGVKAFKTSFSSVVEDIVLQAEERYERRDALVDVLGSLL